MYNVGFGDAFRVTVRRGDETWRMLVDCGVHSHGQARPLAESVKNIIDDLAEDCGGTPHLDVVVATHHHRDHIVGFADDVGPTSKSTRSGCRSSRTMTTRTPRPTRGADADRAEARGVDRRAAAAAGRQSDRGEAQARAGHGDGGQLAGQRKAHRPVAGPQRARPSPSQSTKYVSFPTRTRRRTPSHRASVGWWRTSSARPVTRRC